MIDIKPEFFSSIISTWEIDKPFSEVIIKKIINILRDIFNIVCSDIFEDEKLTLEELALFVRHIINRALQVQLSKFANSNGKRYISSTYSKKLKKSNDLELLPFTELCIRKEKLDINLATLKEFEDLPGIGGETAKRLIAYRTTYKKFGDIEEIKNVRGVSNKDFKILKEIITVGTPEIVYEPKSELLEKFYNDPTFPSYIALLQEGISFTQKYDEDEPLDSKIINELTTFKNRLILNSIPLEIRLPIIRASDIKEILHNFS
ncbi:MAG: ComEA family DNA-binding protein, partial [Promethearchaeota archaeon]